LALPILAIPFAARGKARHGGDIDTAPSPTEVIEAETAKAVEAEPPKPATGPTSCAAGMVLVEGLYCPNPKQECEDWVDDPAKFPYARCAKFKSPATCDGEKVAMRFCIDKEEFTAPGDELPTGDVSYNDAAKVCASEGKRLCGEQEWTFACEGEEMRPYPYGFERDASACNFEQGHLTNPDGTLRDGRVPESANAQCQSPFGVHNMVGNVDEWITLEKPHYSQRAGGKKMMSGLKGGWWGPLRNRCRPVTVDHDEVFHELQTGIRCCADSSGK
jgi:hypothetical protein